MRILVTSDHHVGDQYSACPAKAVVTDEDQARKIVLHPWQVYLNECWDYCRKTIGKVDIAILNGDSMEGEAQKSGGHGLTISKMSDQVGAAIQHFGWIRDAAKKVFVVKGCVTPGQRVLTADLKWKDVGSLDIGDRLLSFEDHPLPGSKRRWTSAEVVRSYPAKAQVCRVTLSDGTSLVCTLDHPWLVRNGTVMKWTTAQSLRSGRSRIVKLLPTWDSLTDRDGGWLAGFYDSEGSISQFNSQHGHWGKGGNVFRITASQKPGVVFDKATRLLVDHGYDFSTYVKGTNTRNIHLKGGYSETLRFLGSVRPHRLLEKFSINRFYDHAVRGLEDVQVEEIQNLGVQEIISLTTTTGTYLVEGFGSHNTPYHEGHVAQAVEGFAEGLGADKWPHTGLRTGTRFWYEAAGLTINASHHMTRGWIYPAGGADRTALFNLAASALGKLPRADIIIRSHNHLRRVLGVYDKDVIFTPAWKLVTPWAAKVMEETRAELYSDIGMILIEITNKKVFVDWRSFSFKSFPLQVGHE